MTNRGDKPYHSDEFLSAQMTHGVETVKLLGMVTLASEFNLFAGIGILILMGLVFGVGNVLLSSLLGPKRHGDIKGTVYESGVDPIGHARRRFNVRFYIVAMTFLLFDVEIVFLYPWAVTFPSLGGPEGEALSPVFLFRMLVFIMLTVIAFLYAWRKGVFRYD